MKICPLCGESFIFLNDNGICDHCQFLIQENRLSKEKAIWLRDGKRCRYCGKKLPFSKKTIDHFIPKSKGGGNDYSNLITACANCNRNKGKKMPREENVLFVENNWFREN